MTHPTDVLLQEYADDELPSGRRAELARHVHGCEVCRARIARLAELRARLREIVDREPVDDFDAPSGIGFPSSERGRGMQFLLRAAAAVILFGLGYGIGAGRAAPEASPVVAGDVSSGAAAEVQRIGARCTSRRSPPLTTARPSRWPQRP